MLDMDKLMVESVIRNMKGKFTWNDLVKEVHKTKELPKWFISKILYNFIENYKILSNGYYFWWKENVQNNYI